MMRFDNLYSTIIEKDEHKKTTEYKKLSPKMKKSVDFIFQQMDANSYPKVMLLVFVEEPNFINDMI